jgi:hypothetical protein
VTFANYNEPTQGRIMLTGRPSEMRVMWTTLNASRPAVRFGTATGQLTLTAAASSSTYHREQLCGAPANADGWRDPGLLHSAVLTGLRPGTHFPLTTSQVRHVTPICVSCVSCGSCRVV